MSFSNVTQHTARKQHRCDWCPERIEIGEKYTAQACMYEGDFSSSKYHPECFDAACTLGEWEIGHYTCWRGTTVETCDEDPRKEAKP